MCRINKRNRVACTMAGEVLVSTHLRRGSGKYRYTRCLLVYGHSYQVEEEKEVKGKREGEMIEEIARTDSICAR